MSLILTVAYRGKPLTLELGRHEETIDLPGGDGTYARRVTGIVSYRGRVLDGLPKGMGQGDEIHLRTRRLRGCFWVLDRKGDIKGSGVIRCPELEPAPCP